MTSRHEVRALRSLAVVALGALAAWEIAVRALRVPAYLLPPPSSIIRRIFVDYRLFATHAWVDPRRGAGGLRRSPSS